MSHITPAQLNINLDIQCVNIFFQKQENKIKDNFCTPGSLSRIGFFSAASVSGRDRFSFFLEICSRYPLFVPFQEKLSHIYLTLIYYDVKISQVSHKYPILKYFTPLISLI